MSQSSDRHKMGICSNCGMAKKIAARALCWSCYSRGTGKLTDIARCYPLIMENRTKWTDREYESAMYMIQQGFTYREIAKELGRSLMSVKERFRGKKSAIRGME